MTESSSSSANSDEHMRSSLLKTRLELYGVYETPEALRADMEKYQAESYFFHAEQPINNGMDDKTMRMIARRTPARETKIVRHYGALALSSYTLMALFHYNCYHY